jgi:GT2 family glycosyltransferase
MVTYHSDLELVQASLVALRKAADYAVVRGIHRVDVRVVDNSLSDAYHEHLARGVKRAQANEACGTWAVVRPRTNLGYGGAQNLGMAGAEDKYRLILNPDVVMDEKALWEATRLMEQRPEVDLVTPYAVDGEGKRQYLCKRYPTILDLAIRGLLPPSLQGLFRGRAQAYEMQGITEEETTVGVPIASGCFMFLRGEAWDALDGFNPRFFLYFEDFDLSLRLNQRSKVIAYEPRVKIAHYGGKTSGKGLKHIALFVRSALMFYRLHGWRWL